MGETTSFGRDILIVTNYYHPEPTGSAPTITDLTAWLAENGNSVDVLTTRPSYPIGKIFNGYESGQRDHENYRGVNVTRLRSITVPSRGLAGRLISELSFLIAVLVNRKTKHNRIICFCPSIFTILAGSLLKGRNGVLLGVVHDVQSGLARSLEFGVGVFLTKMLEGLEAWGFNRCDSLVALSEGMANELKRIGVKTEILVIPPQVDTREIVPVRELDIDRPILLYSGNLGRKQGLSQILDLAKVLQDRNIPAHIYIRGEGSEKLELESAIHAYKISNISIRGLVGRDELSESFGEAAIHLVPQSPAGANFALPSKIFSIMAAQRPFVATAMEGTPLERLAHESGAGLVVPPNQPKAFADAIEFLLRNKAERQKMGRAGRDFVVAHFDRQVVCRRILECLDKATYNRHVV